MVNIGMIGSGYTKSHSVEGSIFVALAGDLDEGAHFIRASFSDMPNTESGNRFHPDYPFLAASGWVGTWSGDGHDIHRSWTEEEDVQEEYFATHASMTNEALGEHGSLTYTAVDMVARTCSARYRLNHTKTFWADHHAKWDFYASGMRIDFDKGTNFLCCVLTAEDWESWNTKLRDVLANTVETIDRPEGVSTYCYISFTQDILINGKPYAAGDTVKLASPSFEITTTLPTTLVAHYK